MFCAVIEKIHLCQQSQMTNPRASDILDQLLLSTELTKETCRLIAQYARTPTREEYVKLMQSELTREKKQYNRHFARANKLKREWQEEEQRTTKRLRKEKQAMASKREEMDLTHSLNSLLPLGSDCKAGGWIYFASLEKKQIPRGYPVRITRIRCLLSFTYTKQTRPFGVVDVFDCEYTASNPLASKEIANAKDLQIYDCDAIEQLEKEIAEDEKEPVSVEGERRHRIVYLYRLWTESYSPESKKEKFVDVAS